MSHDCDCSTETPGILWPWMPNGDDSLPWVQRCDDCQTYSDDDAAAEALVELIGGQVMWAFAAEHIPEATEHDYRRPFVFAFRDSSQEDAGWDKWMKERVERFGSRRERYDEAMQETQL